MSRTKVADEHQHGSVADDHRSGRLRLVRNGRQPARSRAAGGLTIAVAIGVMNLATYASTLLAARLLGPGAYGGFAAVLGLLLVVGVLMLGLQTTGARRVAASPGDVGEIERTLMRVTYRAAWVLAGVCLLLTPVFDSALHLQSTVDRRARGARGVADDRGGRRGRHPPGRAPLAPAGRGLPGHGPGPARRHPPARVAAQGGRGRPQHGHRLRGACPGRLVVAAPVRAPAQPARLRPPRRRAPSCASSAPTPTPCWRSSPSPTPT